MVAAEGQLKVAIETGLVGPAANGGGPRRVGGGDWYPPTAGAIDSHVIETPAGPLPQESEDEQEVDEEEAQMLRERLTEREGKIYGQSPSGVASSEPWVSAISQRLPTVLAVAGLSLLRWGLLPQAAAQPVAA